MINKTGNSCLGVIEDGRGRPMGLLTGELGDPPRHWTRAITWDCPNTDERKADVADALPIRKARIKETVSVATINRKKGGQFFRLPLSMRI